jgi:hypothetical protein
MLGVQIKIINHLSSQAASSAPTGYIKGHCGAHLVLLSTPQCRRLRKADGDAAYPGISHSLAIKKEIESRADGPLTIIGLD